MDDAHRLRAAIQALVRRFSVSERADVQCCGMTVAQAATLEALRDRPLRLGRLGERLGIAPSTLTRNLARLEENGLVRRRTDPRDRRAAVAELTAAGRRAAERLEEMERAFARSVLARLPPRHRRQVLDGLGDLLDAVRAETEPCCGVAYDHLMEAAPTNGVQTSTTCCNEECCT